MTTVSIIMPVFKVSDYIESSIKSVMAQTYPHLECIIVDDGTPDDSIEKCEHLIADYQGPIKFIILHHEHNRGLSAARNTGTAAATGDYVFYLDSDDMLPADSIEKLLKPMLNDPSIELVTGQHQCFPEPQPTQNHQSTEMEFKTNDEVRRFVFGKKKHNVFAWNKLIQRNFLSHIDLCFVEGLLWEDILWDFFLLKHLSHLCVIPDVTYHYRQRPDSISMGTAKAKKSPHLDVIYSTIADNLNEGDGGREAHIYFNGFCGYFLRHPKVPEAYSQAVKFRNALREGHYTKEASRLSLMMFLSKTWLGRCMISAGLSLR